MDKTDGWKIWEGRIVEGKFPLRQWLGGSDHSAVFLTDLAEGQKAAVKLVAAGPDAERQLANWATAAKLSHPHLIRLFEMGRCRFDGTPLLYLVTEYADEDLSQIIPQRPLTPAEVADMLPPVLDALSYVHSRGLVHSRVRPSNIFAVGEQLKLSTDRVSARGESSGRLTSRTIYDAPEVAAGEIYPAIDVWSLGITLVEVLTQNLPADGREETTQKDPAVPGSIPEPFRSIAREALHREVKRRCTIADIKAWRPPQQEPGEAPAPIVTAPSAEKTNRNQWLVAVASVIVLVVAGVFVGRKLVTAHEETPPIVQNETKVEPAQPAPFDGAVAHQVLPDIPRSAKNTIRGTIKILVRVDADAAGKVTNAKVIKSGPSGYFEKLTLAAVQNFEFEPPRSNGQAEASTWILRFDLSKGSTKAFASRDRGHR